MAHNGTVVPLCITNPNPIPNPNLYRNFYRVFGGFRQILMYIGTVVCIDNPKH